ncbi:MAG: nuclear transport factor 2 family protein [Reichenbachiella sp.]
MIKEHVKLIERFYTAFQNKKADEMISCYHQDLEFEDPAFGTLDYTQTCAMWSMLIEAGKDLEISFKNAWSENEFGGADWEAKYTFSKTGRKVHNRIDAKFLFKDNLIVGHRDHFDFYKWTRMALGGPGILLGWTNYLQKKVNTNVLNLLEKWISTH